MGNQDLDPEEIHSYEVGYQTQLLEQFRIRIDFFYNRLAQLIAFQRPIFTIVSSALPPVPAGSQYINVGGGEVVGVEVGIDVLISSWLKGFLNYSYQDRRGHLPAMGFAPHHKGNVGLTFTFPHGLSATTLVHYVGDLDTLASGVYAYTLTHVRLGYRFQVFGNKTELALQVANLFNDVHQEVPGGDLIERRLSGTIQAQF
jgi:iron complex outermembrane receptor protein